MVYTSMIAAKSNNARFVNVREDSLIYACHCGGSPLPLLHPLGGVSGDGERRMLGMLCFEVRCPRYTIRVVLKQKYPSYKIQIGRLCEILSLKQMEESELVG